MGSSASTTETITSGVGLWSAEHTGGGPLYQTDG